LVSEFLKHTGASGLAGRITSKAGAAGVLSLILKKTLDIIPFGNTGNTPRLASMNLLFVVYLLDCMTVLQPTEELIVQQVAQIEAPRLQRSSKRAAR
jgi:hypothetical protein